MMENMDKERDEERGERSHLRVPISLRHVDSLGRAIFAFGGIITSGSDGTTRTTSISIAQGQTTATTRL